MSRLVIGSLGLLATIAVARAEPVRLDGAELDRVVAGAPALAGTICPSCILGGILDRLRGPRAAPPPSQPPSQPPTGPSLDDIINGSPIKF